AEHGLHHFGSSCLDQAIEAQDFALANREQDAINSVSCSGPLASNTTSPISTSHTGKMPSTGRLTMS
ncbi:MAG: hypothetical protein MO846_12560, partial [Candidatus Devosia symbiotica]|nr:hypothetical protein [Candidatus Devosia symbiotica]